MADGKAKRMWALPGAEITAPRALLMRRDLHEAEIGIGHDPEDRAEFPHAPKTIG